MKIKLTDQQLLIISLAVNLVLLSVFAIFWRSLAQWFNPIYAPALSCEQLSQSYSARYRALDDPITKKIDQGDLDFSEDERKLLYKISQLDEHAKEIQAICEKKEPTE